MLAYTYTYIHTYICTYACVQKIEPVGLFENRHGILARGIWTWTGFAAVTSSTAAHISNVASTARQAHAPSERV
jgi:hypothetical protein